MACSPVPSGAYRAPPPPINISGSIVSGGSLGPHKRHAISHSGNTDWKDIILLGSKLDTVSDVNRRKGLASAAWNKHTAVLSNKNLPLFIKVKYFEALISSIFLYQCGIWTLTAKLNQTIDIFQRRFLRRIDLSQMVGFLIVLKQNRENKLLRYLHRFNS